MDGCRPPLSPEWLLVEAIRLVTAEGLTVQVTGRDAVRQLLRDAAELLTLLGQDPCPDEGPGAVSEAPAGA
jgi:hypothetical protein